jgi:Tol biopolymer transport system component
MVRCSQPAPVLRGFLVAASLAVALWLPAGEAAQGSSGAHSPPNLVGWIVYSNAQGIWVMDADGSNHRQVTHPGTEHADYDPALSPDGSTIAFRSSRATPPDSIMLVDIDGTNERSLAVLAGPPTGYGMAQQGWSPDGSKLAFTCNCPQNTHSFGPHSGVYTANADGTGLTKLNEDGQYPDWSPDGTRVVYMADRDGNHELSIMNADGTGETNLTRHPASDNVPRWSPDGSTIVFFSDRDGNEEIYTIRPDGTGLTRITDTPAYEEFPIWSPDGRIAFNRGEPHDTETPPTWHLVHADGTGEVPLPQLDAVEAGFADWIAGAPTDRPSTPAPAGSEAATAVATPIDGFAGRIVYHDAAGDLWTMDTDGTGRIRLTDSGAGFDFDPRWSPDGTQVLFRTSRYPGAPNADGLMLVGADGTDERPLLPHGLR